MLNKAFETLELLSQTSGNKNKKEIMEMNGSDELRYLLNLAFNPYITFGVKEFKIDESTRLCPSLETIKQLAVRLRDREVTGNEAREMLKNTLSSENRLACKWLTAIFKKDVKIGADIKTINKVFKGLIPTFDVGLCDAMDEKDIEKKRIPKGEWVIEPKFDGLRCITLVDEHGDVTFLSRKGKELYNLSHIAKEIKSLGVISTVLDGEIYAGNFEDSISITHTQSHHENKKEAQYFIFDMLTLNEWKNQTSENYVIRKQKLNQIVYGKSPLYLNIVNSTTMPETFDQASEVYQKILDKGFEGVVLKEINANYPFGRSKCWLKWKPFITLDIEIVGYEEGEGRNKGRLGKFICDYKGQKVKVGGGYNDELREKFWIEKDVMIGQIIEVKAQEVTKDGSLRFPVFMRLRIDK